MRQIIFIDRDGVINRDPGGWTEHSYVTRWEDFHFLEGSLGALKRLSDRGYEIAIVSNQAGINKGYFTPAQLGAINEKMLKEMSEYGIKIRSVNYCPHRNEDKCDCRKPRTGLLKKAAAGLKVKFDEIYMIGDGRTDIEAGKEIGCKTILVLSGKSGSMDVGEWKVKPDYIKRDLKEAVDFMLQQEVKNG
ncbi:MAG: HAD family hydrolase [Candidatus Omnitrophica bacterium]|nr:HAD family hydrolase [Candidatus Omnitrophota bacterium]